jgi:hypothetical protein
MRVQCPASYRYSSHFVTTSVVCRFPMCYLACCAHNGTCCGSNCSMGATGKTGQAGKETGKDSRHRPEKPEQPGRIQGRKPEHDLNVARTNVRSMLFVGTRSCCFISLVRKDMRNTWQCPLLPSASHAVQPFLNVAALKTFCVTAHRVRCNQGMRCSSPGWIALFKRDITNRGGQHRGRVGVAEG